MSCETRKTNNVLIADCMGLKQVNVYLEDFGPGSGKSPSLMRAKPGPPIGRRWVRPRLLINSSAGATRTTSLVVWRHTFSRRFSAVWRSKSSLGNL